MYLEENENGFPRCSANIYMAFLVTGQVGKRSFSATWSVLSEGEFKVRWSPYESCHKTAPRQDSGARLRQLSSLTGLTQAGQEPTLSAPCFGGWKLHFVQASLAFLPKSGNTQRGGPRAAAKCPKKPKRKWGVKAVPALTCYLFQAQKTSKSTCGCLTA